MSAQSIGNDTSPVNRELNPTSGIMIIFSGPSGVGKGTLIKRLMNIPGFQPNYFSISCTSRCPRGTEVDGVDYQFITTNEFTEKISGGKFLECEKVGDHWYGTLSEPVIQALKERKKVFLDVDVRGALNIKENIKLLYNNVPVFDVFIMPPSLDELERRLRVRGTETEKQIEGRLSRAQIEMLSVNSFTHQVVNGNLDACVEEITKKFLKHFIL